MIGIAGCRDQSSVAPDVIPSPPERAAFGDVIDGLPIVRVGGGDVAVVMESDTVVLRAIVNDRVTDLVRFIPREDNCPVIDLASTYFVHGHTCGEWEWMELPLPGKRLECDELAWTGSDIVVAHRSRANTATELPVTCR